MNRLHRRAVFAGALACAAAVLVADFAVAQTYPSRPIRFVVPAGPGATTDIVPRIVAAKLSERLGWTVVTENRPGGNFVVGTQAVTQAPPDGYTVLAAVSSLTILPSSLKDLPFDVQRDLIPVTRTANLLILVISNPAQPYKTFAEMIAYAKAHPGKLSYGSAAQGSWTHLAFELARRQAGVEMVNVPYRDATFFNDIISGVVPVGVNTVSTVLPAVKAGKLNALAIIGPKRSPQLPDVPTVGEAGVGEVDADAWLGIMVRAGTPASIVNTLNREIVAVLRLPEVQKQLVNMGAVPAPETPEDFRRKFDGDIARWAKLIREAGIKTQ